MDASQARQTMLGELVAHTRTVVVAGVATGVTETGDGPPLLLLHGGIQCGAAMWAPVVGRLTPHHRVVVPDLPGFGGSAPVPRLDAEALARWLVDLLRVVVRDRPVLVAHSLVGGPTARFAAGDGGARLAGLVLYGTPAVGPWRMPVGLRHAALRFALHPSPRNGERFERFALRDLDALRRRDPAWFAAFSAYNRHGARQPAVRRAMRQLLAAGTRRVPDADLARIGVPVALLWGRHDRMVPPAVAQHAAARHGWPLRVVEGAAHAPHVEEPDAFVAALAALSRVP